MKSPFKFLDSYTLADRDSFFGREKEVEQLYTMVNQNRLILVYGQSGTGKTSLVQCGLASQFETVDWYPLFIRRGDDINRALDDALRRALKDELFDTYAETIEELFALYVRPVYLLFDQFEELFILGTPEEQKTFFENMAVLNAARLPCRIVFILREEFLAHLYDFERIIPNLLDRRLRVEPMSYGKVGEVIRRSCARFNIELEDPEHNVEQIVQNLRAGTVGINLPYLQVYLDMLYREDLRRTYPDAPPETDLPELTFTTEEIEAFGKIDNVLDQFLEEQSIALQAELAGRHPGFPNNGVMRVLDLFVTEEGTKNPLEYTRDGEQILIAEEVLALLPQLTGPALSDVLHELENRRLLRFSENHIELSHDTLATLIDQKRTDEQRQLNAILRQLKTAYAGYSRTQEYLTRKQLNAYEDFLPKLSLDRDIENFIAASRAQVSAREREDRDRRDREVQLQQEKLSEQRNARRQRLFSGVLGLALLAAVYLGYQSTVQSSRLSQQQEQLAAALSETDAALSEAKQARANLTKIEAEDIFQRAEYMDSLGHIQERNYLLDDAYEKLADYRQDTLLRDLIEKIRVLRDAE